MSGNADRAGGVASPSSRPLISVAQAGRALGIKTTTAYEWARRGDLPGLVRLGGRMYVRAAVLERFIAGEDAGAVPIDGPFAAPGLCTEFN